MTLPGSRLLSFASGWFDSATMHRTFEPLVADWQREWLDASGWRRTVALLKGLSAFCVAALVSAPAIARTRAPKPLTDELARRVAIVTAVGLAVLMSPMVLNFEPSRLRILMILVALPSAMALSFPFAMTAAVDTIRRFAEIDEHVARATVLKLALLSVVLMLFSQGWIAPAANQAWRRATSHGRTLPSPGARELNTLQLVMTRAEIANSNDPTRYSYGLVIQHEISKRVAVASLPVLLLWLRWRELNRRGPINQRATMATAVSLFTFAVPWYLSRPIETAWSLPAGAGMWVALCLFALMDTLRVRLASRFRAYA